MKYLSIDLEATGIEEGVHLIQLAFVPVDADKKTVEMPLGRETLVWCPTFEELKPILNKWVLEHNEGLIREANEKGIRPEKVKDWIQEYLDMPELKRYFSGQKPVLLGKSMSALDIPLLTRYLGREFMMSRFHHHTVDLTCVARFFSDAKMLPPGCNGTTSLLNFFGIKQEAEHRALSDAVDMAKLYLKLAEWAEKKQNPPAAAGTPNT